MKFAFHYIALLVAFIGIVAASSAAGPKPSTEDDEAEITTALAKLPDADKEIATAQRWCAIQKGNRLGSMGTPVKVVLDGKPVFLCCAGCKKRVFSGICGRMSVGEMVWGG